MTWHETDVAPYAENSEGYIAGGCLPRDFNKLYMARHDKTVSLIYS